jgi:hypothetical protein
MGKLTRGALWVGFWPAGLLASARAGRRKDTERIVNAIETSNATPAPLSPELVAHREQTVQALEGKKVNGPGYLWACFKSGFSAPKR